MPKKIPNIENKIIEIVNPNNGLSMREISKKLNISHPTVSKYCNILEARGSVIFEHYGNVIVVKRNDKT